MTVHERISRIDDGSNDQGRPNVKPPEGYSQAQPTDERPGIFYWANSRASIWVSSNVADHGA